MKTLEEAFITAHYQATADDTVVVFGSFYSVSAVLIYMRIAATIKKNIDGLVQ